MNTVYLQLQNTLDQGKIVNTYDLIHYNSIYPTSAADVTLNTSTGMIQFNQTGLYYINWFVVTNSAASSDPNGTVKISVVTSEGAEITVEAPVADSQINGAGMITITKAGTQLFLRNDGAAFQYGTTMAVANLTIISVNEIDDTTPPPPPDCKSSTVVNFSNGGIDPTNPLTWPIIFEALQISWSLNHFTKLKDTFTPQGLEQELGLPTGVLSSFLVNRSLEPALTSMQGTLDTSLQTLTWLSDEGANAGLISMDAYIGHSTVGIVPALVNADLPVLSLIAGPPYPQIVSRNGIITSFAAEYDALAAIDVSLFGAIQGILTTLNSVISTVAGGIAVVISTLGSIGTLLTGLGAPLPSDFADILNRLILKQVEIGTATTNHHMHAVLWHATRDKKPSTGGAVDWHKVAEVDLGAIPFAELGLFDTILSSLGDLIAAGGNLLSSILTLLGSKGTPNQGGLNSMPLSSGLVKDLNHEVKNGDYLMVQFTLVGEDNTTILAGVLASNLMASVSIK